jgi:membrane protein implicated in regulation of membrane protease activity
VPPRDDGPGPLAWLIAIVSLALPWAGLGLGIYGIWLASAGNGVGWWWLAAGVAAIVADIVIDWVWAHPAVSKSDQPDLNRRSAQLIGRVVVVEEAIEGGRGKVRVGDTLWPAEGPDALCGARVTVTAARGNLLIVTPQ